MTALTAKLLELHDKLPAGSKSSVYRLEGVPVCKVQIRDGKRTRTLLSRGDDEDDAVANMRAYLTKNNLLPV